MFVNTRRSARFARLVYQEVLGMNPIQKYCCIGYLCATVAMSFLERVLYKNIVVLECCIRMLY